MNNKHLLLVSLLLLLVFLSVNSVSAENSTDDIVSSEFDSDVGIDSSDVLIDANQEVISEQSSDPLPNIEKGSVSGGVDFINAHPWAPSNPVNGNKGNITYDIPSNAKIKSAYVYVNVYSGSGGTNYGAYANISVKTDNGYLNNTESLISSVSSRDGVNYIINDHITRCYSDYMIFYNVTEFLQGLNGTSVSVNVHSYPMSGYSFDGRIKLVSLFVAWDDGDSDVINYWLNAGQAWTDSTDEGLYHTFDLTGVSIDDVTASLTNIALSSEDAMYYINGNIFFSESEDDVYVSGAYYQYHKWDVTNYLEDNCLNVTYVPMGGAYGPSFKNAVSLLTIKQPGIEEPLSADVSIKIADYSKSIVYPGFANALTVNINTNKAGKYVINLLADDEIVNTTEIDLVEGVNTFTIIDPTSRQLNPSSKYVGASGSYDTVNYQAKLLFKNKEVNQSSCIAKVLYNGYLGKDTYDETNLMSFFNTTISGDIVILTNGTYTGSSTKYPLVNYTVAIPDNSNVVKAFMYVTYCWAKDALDNIDMFNATFNGNKLTPVFFARDQSNLESVYGYGSVVYDVSDYVGTGINSFDLIKNIGSVAVYPSTLVYMYNTTGSKLIKEVYISNGADLLGTSGGTRNPIRVDSGIVVNSTDVKEAIVYIFANGAADGEANVVVNGEIFEHPWNGNTESTDLYSNDITNIIRDENEISVVLKFGGITALQQIIVLTKDLKENDESGTNSTDNPSQSNNSGTSSDASSQNNKVIKKTKITAKKKTFKAKIKVKKYTITLKAGKKPVKKVWVTLKIKGKTFKAKTNAKGKATFKIKKLTKKGTYKAKISFKGNQNYLKSSKTVRITVKK